MLFYWKIQQLFQEFVQLLQLWVFLFISIHLFRMQSDRLLLVEFQGLQLHLLSIRILLHLLAGELKCERKFLNFSPVLLKDLFIQIKSKRLIMIQKMIEWSGKLNYISEFEIGFVFSYLVLCMTLRQRIWVHNQLCLKQKLILMEEK